MDSHQRKVATPIYHQIALDIANKIVNGKYRYGEKIKGRSTLASKYNVSPETIRRAVALLEDMDIVEVLPNVGIEVCSEEKAVEFVDKFRDIQSLTNIRNKITALMCEINEKNQELQNSIRQLVEGTEQLKVVNPFMPFELEVRGDASIVGKSISEVNFWHNTRMTIVGIKRGKETILSPGPYLNFHEGDIIVVVGDEESYNRAKKFING